MNTDGFDAEFILPDGDNLLLGLTFRREVIMVQFRSSMELEDWTAAFQESGD